MHKYRNRLRKTLEGKFGEETAKKIHFLFPKGNIYSYSREIEEWREARRRTRCIEHADETGKARENTRQTSRKRTRIEEEGLAWLVKPRPKRGRINDGKNSIFKKIPVEEQWRRRQTQVDVGIPGSTHHVSGFRNSTNFIIHMNYY